MIFSRLPAFHFKKAYYFKIWKWNWCIHILNQPLYFFSFDLVDQQFPAPNPMFGCHNPSDSCPSSQALLLRNYNRYNNLSLYEFVFALFLFFLVLSHQLMSDSFHWHHMRLAHLLVIFRSVNSPWSHIKPRVCLYGVWVVNPNLFWG